MLEDIRQELLRRIGENIKPQRASRLAEVLWFRQCSNKLGIVLEVISVLLAGETWTAFVDAFELTMAYDLCLRVIDLRERSSAIRAARAQGSVYRQGNLSR